VEIGILIGMFLESWESYTEVTIYFSILLFVVKNKTLFTANYDSHNVKSRQCENLHFPHSQLTLYQNGIYFTGIDIFNK
jgi:hypothetical protein